MYQRLSIVEHLPTAYLAGCLTTCAVQCLVDHVKEISVDGD